MNDILLSILLGIVEGLTEFLPVSSTAHLRITQALCRVELTDPFWKMYTVVIQLGAVLCLPVYFWRRIGQFARTFPRGASGAGTVLDHPLTLTIIAFMVTAAPAYLLSKVIGHNLESLYIIGLSLVIGGAVMWVVDSLCRRVSTPAMDNMGLLQAVWIGAAQILSAVFPGTSRSMATIVAGQLAGLSRPAALEFSFFLSIPTMLMATLYDLSKVLRPTEAGGLQLSSHQWVVLLIGFVVSFAVALAVVAWFMHWVRKHGFVPFAIWRLVVGAGVLVWAFAR